LICSARQTPDGVILSVRPSLIPQSTILASVRGAYNAVWVRGEYGADTFYYGRGAGAHPTGVAVVSDLMRVAREIRHGNPQRVSPFAHSKLGEYKPVPVVLRRSAYYLRFRVQDRPGIIAQLAAALAAESVSIDAVLQLPHLNWRDLPFVITVEPATEQSVRAAIARMLELNFLIEPPLALPMEEPL
jgi:homoserine dehydrogenase